MTKYLKLEVSYKFLIAASDYNVKGSQRTKEDTINTKIQIDRTIIGPFHLEASNDAVKSD
jgi:hypothetical protein